MKYIEILEKWEENPKEFTGICQAVLFCVGKQAEVECEALFQPTRDERIEANHHLLYWGCPNTAISIGLNDFRCNVLLFLAAMNNEL